MRKKASLMCKVLISGGGTGGHIFPAIAIAKELKKQRPDIKIQFVGARGKMEMRKVPEAGFPIIALWISGYDRKRSLKNLLLPIKLISSLLVCCWVLLKFRPSFVVGVGGYASGPLLFVASLFGIPTAIQEQNGYPGITNKLLAPRVRKIFVAFPGMDKFFSKEKIVFSGNPVRDDFKILPDQNESREFFNLETNKLTVLVFGGSLGAKTLNEGMAQNMELIKQNSEIQWIWQVGALYHDQYKDCDTSNLENVVTLQFIREMDNAYAAADLVVARAGAMSLAELMVCGKPALLVPSPNVAEDHQTKNAQALVDENAAELCRDDEFITHFDRVIGLVNNSIRRTELSDNALRLGLPNASSSIASELLKLK